MNKIFHYLACLDIAQIQQFARKINRVVSHSLIIFLEK